MDAKGFIARIRVAAEAVKRWGKGRLRERMDAVIVHEDIEGLAIAEGQGFDAAHAAAVIQAPDTPRPITAGARRILRAMAGRDEPPGRQR